MLEVQHLGLSVHYNGQTVQAVSDVSLQVKPGRVLALVGESGCGKSLTAQAMLRLGEFQGVEKTQGSVYLDGVDLESMDADAIRKVRGGRIAMVFQEPMTALNPVFTVGDQIIEVIMLHLPMNKAQAKERTIHLLQQVGLQQPEQLLGQYPDALSGGMRQRVLIAMAMAADPDYIIADEPTTALDVSVQKRIIMLLRDLQRSRGLGMLLVTHDFGLVAEMADDVAVMYAGEVIEYGPVHALFASPMHPYTRALMACRPESHTSKHALTVIPGHVPSPGSWPEGCRFAARCAYADAACTMTAVDEKAWENNTHYARCVHAEVAASCPC